MGNLYSDLKEYDNAKNAYLKALEIKPDKEEVIFNLACAFCLEKNKAEALHYLQKAIELNPEYKNAPKDTDFEWLWADADFLVLVQAED